MEFKIKNNKSKNSQVRKSSCAYVEYVKCVIGIIILRVEKLLGSYVEYVICVIAMINSNNSYYCFLSLQMSGFWAKVNNFLKKLACKEYNSAHYHK